MALFNLTPKAPIQGKVGGFKQWVEIINRHPNKGIRILLEVILRGFNKNYSEDHRLARENHISGLVNQLANMGLEPLPNYYSLPVNVLYDSWIVYFKNLEYIDECKGN